MIPPTRDSAWIVQDERIRDSACRPARLSMFMREA